MNDDQIKQWLQKPAKRTSSPEDNFQGIKKQYQQAKQQDDFLTLGIASLLAMLLVILGPMFTIFQNRKTHSANSKGEAS